MTHERESKEFYPIATALSHRMPGFPFGHFYRLEMVRRLEQGTLGKKEKSRWKPTGAMSCRFWSPYFEKEL